MHFSRTPRHPDQPDRCGCSSRLTPALWSRARIRPVAHLPMAAAESVASSGVPFRDALPIEFRRSVCAGRSPICPRSLSDLPHIVGSLRGVLPPWPVHDDAGASRTRRHPGPRNVRVDRAFPAPAVLVNRAGKRRVRPGLRPGHRVPAEGRVVDPRALDHRLPCAESFGPRHTGPVNALDDSLLNLSLCNAGAFFLAVSIPAVAAVDIARQKAEFSELIQAVKDSEGHVVSRVQRVLHDRVIAVLMTISNSGAVDARSLDEAIDEIRGVASEARRVTS